MTNEEQTLQPLPTPATIPHVPDGDYVLTITDASGREQLVKVKGGGHITIVISRP